MSRDKQIKLRGVLVAAMALSLIAALGGGHSQAGTSLAQETDGAIEVDCDAAQGGIQSECTYVPGSSFNIQIHITQPPAGGYNSSQAKVEWTVGVVNYLPTASLADEALASNCTILGRSNSWEEFGLPSVVFVCTPTPAGLFTDTGAFLTFEFQCNSDPNAPSPPAGLESDQSLLRLVPRPGDVQQGSHFTDLNSAAIEPGPTLTNATVTCGDGPTDGAPGPAGEASQTGGDFGSFVQDVTVSPTLPTTGAELAADGGFSVGLWAMIGGLLVAAAAGLTVFGWRSTRAR